jgi:glycerate dehydrogenase
MNAVFLDLQTFNPELDLTKVQAPIEHLDCHQLTCAGTLLSRCQNKEVIITNKVVLNREILSQLPQLKLICIAATGTNNVDLDAAKEFGIAVTNVSGYAKNSVSQYVFAMLLEHLNHTSHFINNTRKNRWQQSPTFCQIDKSINELAGKTLGIIGYGAIGKQVATIAKAFGMEVLISEHINQQTIRSGRTPFEQVLKQADIISLHCPLTDSTERLINQQTLSLIKDGAILINTARGQLIDDYALLAALDSKQLGAAIIDVLNQEPPTNEHPLIKNNRENLYLSAHLAWGSIEAQQLLLNTIGDNIASFIAGKNLNRIV